MALISSFQIWCKDINSTYCVFLRYIVLDFTDVFYLFFIISIVRMKHELQIFGHFNPWSELKKEMSFFNQVDDFCTGWSLYRALNKFLVWEQSQYYSIEKIADILKQLDFFFSIDHMLGFWNPVFFCLLLQSILNISKYMYA